MLRPISFAAAIALTSQRPDGWNYWHDHRHLISGAELIVDGKVVKELTVDGEDHSNRIYDAIADWEIEQEDAAAEAVSLEGMAA